MSETDEDIEALNLRHSVRRYGHGPATDRHPPENLIGWLRDGGAGWDEDG